jgi:hypothetical protein
MLADTATMHADVNNTLFVTTTERARDADLSRA